MDRASLGFGIGPLVLLGLRQGHGEDRSARRSCKTIPRALSVATRGDVGLPTRARSAPAVSDALRQLCESVRGRPSLRRNVSLCRHTMLDPPAKAWLAFNTTRVSMRHAAS